MRVHPIRDASAASGETRLGDVLKRLREQHGLSLRTLATRAGFSPSFLSQLENGQVSPSIASLDKIAAELGVTLADFSEPHRPRVRRWYALIPDRASPVGGPALAWNR